MKFLQAAVLSAIFVGYVIASHLDYDLYIILCDAIDKGRLDIAVDLVKQNEKLGDYGVEHVIRKDDPAFIANFVNQTNQANATTLFTLLNESPIETVEEVLAKVDFPQQALVDLASSPVVAYYPDESLVLLNKIVKPEDQEKFVEKAIELLARTSFDTSPLLNALKGKTFRSERLEHLAIQKTFMEIVEHGTVGLLPDDICKHAAITPKLYADALIVSAGWWKHDSMRQFLLQNADRYDLQAVKEKEAYADLKPEFHDDIEEVFGEAAPGGTRTRTYDIQTVEKAEEVFEELGSSGISKGIFSIASDFVALDASTRGTSLAIQKVFMEGVIKSGTVDLLPDDIYKHAAITPELYADALIESVGWGKYDMRQFLLKRADQYDLEAVKEKAGYAGLKLEFHDVIEDALGRAAPRGTRTRAYDIQAVEKARETFDKLGSSGIPEDVFSIVGESVMRNPPKRRSQIAYTKAPENVVSDVPGTLTTKTESSKIRKRKGGKGKGKGKKKGRKWTDKS